MIARGAPGRDASGAASPSVRDVVGRGGLPGVELEHPEGGRVELSLHGGHILSWTRRGGDDVLFLGSRAAFDGVTAIRGGVPVIFPQFGPGPLPKHGFARTARWTLAGFRADESRVAAQLTLRDDAATHRIWPHVFRLELDVELETRLTMRLSVTNAGDAPFDMTAALHTYLRVADIASVRLLGLHGIRYVDQLAGGAVRDETDTALTVGGPVDRIYAGVSGALRLDDPAGGRAVEIVQDGFPDTVVWNPWSQGAAALSDLADHEYRTMLCVEAAAAAAPLRIGSGERWQGMQRIGPLAGA
jgi:glucose-6-phosphate 1-epimerase